MHVMVCNVDLPTTGQPLKILNEQVLSIEKQIASITHTWIVYHWIEILKELQIKKFI